MVVVHQATIKQQRTSHRHTLPPIRSTAATKTTKETKIQQQTGRLESTNNFQNCSTRLGELVSNFKFNNFHSALVSYWSVSLFDYFYSKIAL